MNKACAKILHPLDSVFCLYFLVIVKDLLKKYSIA